MQVLLDDGLPVEEFAQTAQRMTNEVVEGAAMGARRGVKGWRTDESAGQWTSCLSRAEAAAGEARRRGPPSAP
jgi:hypothetical protein